MEAIDNFKNLKAEFETKKKLAFDELKTEFMKHAKIVFDKYPEITSFGVKAYTSSEFNDGDPNFWAFHNCPENVLINDQELDEAISDNDIEDNSPEYKAIEDKYTAVSDFFSLFPEDFYEDVFSEGIITVYREGKVTVEDYYG